MQARQGLKVGKCMLFFGARYKQEPAECTAFMLWHFCWSRSRPLHFAGVALQRGV